MQMAITLKKIRITNGAGSGFIQKKLKQKRLEILWELKMFKSQLMQGKSFFFFLKLKF